MAYMIKRVCKSENPEKLFSIMHDMAPSGADIPITTLGPFRLENNAHVDSVEVWGSSFSDAGDDWCEFRFYREDGIRIYTRRTAGY